MITPFAAWNNFKRERTNKKKDWVKNYIVWQRSVLSESTKDLPPAVYSKATNCVSKVNFSEDVERDYEEEETDMPALPWRKVLSR